MKDKVLAAGGQPVLITLRTDRASYQANESSRALREQLQLTPEEEMVRVKTETDALGFTHEKYQQYYRGVKVEHATYSVHIRKGIIESLSGQIDRVGVLDKVPKVSATAALNQALNFVGATQYMWQVPAEEAGLKQRENNPNATHLPQGELGLLGALTRFQGGRVDPPPMANRMGTSRFDVNKLSVERYATLRTH